MKKLQKEDELCKKQDSSIEIFVKSKCSEFLDYTLKGSDEIEIIMTL